MTLSTVMTVTVATFPMLLTLHISDNHVISLLIPLQAAVINSQITQL